MATASAIRRGETSTTVNGAFSEPLKPPFATAQSPSVSDGDFNSKYRELALRVPRLIERLGVCDAEGVLHEAVLSILDKHSVDAPEFVRYVVRRAISRALGEYRSEQRRKAREQLWALQRSVEGTGADDDPRQTELRELLLASMKRLDPIDRQILSWHYWGDASFVDIAHLLGQGELAVRSRAWRARRTLRAIMKRSSDRL